MGGSSAAKRIGGEFLMPTDYLTTDTELTSIANAIRTKGGTSAALEYPADFITAINAISGGGGGVEEKQINFIDYDGTILHSYTKAEINAMTSESDLPENPSHTGLTAQGWNWTLAQIKTQLTSCPDGPVWVGQMYVTSNGVTEIDIALVDSKILSLKLNLAINGTITIDWGDNSAVETATGSSIYSQIAASSHTYSQSGNYTIKITITSGKASFVGTTNAPILSKQSASTAEENYPYSGSVTGIRLGRDMDIGKYAFLYLVSLKSITIPSTVTSIGANAFQQCHMLAAVVLPNLVTAFSNYTFQNCSSLCRISIPASVTNFGGYTFQYCYTLRQITLPNGIATLSDYIFFNNNALAEIHMPNTITKIGSYAFSTCLTLRKIIISSAVTRFYTSAMAYSYSIGNITIPSSVTQIDAQAFRGCYGVKEYHVKATTPPTLGNSNAFANGPSDFVIYVPYSADHSILNTYKTASQWSTYASYMQEEPQ